MPIKRRLMLITILAAVGGAMFVPFAAAGITTGQRPPMAYLWIGFTVGAACVSALFAWAGLKCADRTELPMPLLRALEAGTTPRNGALSRVVVTPIIAGGLVGAVSEVTVRLAHLPSNPGTLLERLMTIPFAAIVPETMMHLGLMSVMVLLMKRNWPAIIISSAVFVLVFHGSGVPGGAVTQLAVYGINFLFGTLTGWLYARYGMESAYIGHAVGHAIMLGIN